METLKVLARCLSQISRQPHKHLDLLYLALALGVFGEGVSAFSLVVHHDSLRHVTTPQLVVTALGHSCSSSKAGVSASTSINQLFSQPSQLSDLLPRTLLSLQVLNSANLQQACREEPLRYSDSALPALLGTTCTLQVETRRLRRRW